MSKTVSHALWASGGEGLHKSEARCTLCDTGDLVMRFEAEWQRWLEQQMEWYHGDKSAVSFSNYGTWEYFWCRVDFSTIFKDPKVK